MASGERVSLCPHIMETERGVANVAPSSGGKSEGGGDRHSVCEEERASPFCCLDHGANSSVGPILKTLSAKLLLIPADGDTGDVTETIARDSVASSLAPS